MLRHVFLFAILPYFSFGFTEGGGQVLYTPILSTLLEVRGCVTEGGVYKILLGASKYTTDPPTKNVFWPRGGEVIMTPWRPFSPFFAELPELQTGGISTLLIEGALAANPLTQ